METFKHYVKYKTRVDRAARPFLLNNSINYITPFDSERALEVSMPPVINNLPIYEVIPMQDGTWFKIVRLDVYPPRTIATFKPRLYVKAKSGFLPYSGSGK